MQNTIFLLRELKEKRREKERENGNVFILFWLYYYGTIYWYKRYAYMPFSALLIRWLYD